MTSKVGLWSIHMRNSGSSGRRRSSHSSGLTFSFDLTQAGSPCETPVADDCVSGFGSKGTRGAERRGQPGRQRRKGSACPRQLHRPPARPGQAPAGRGVSSNEHVGGIGVTPGRSGVDFFRGTERIDASRPAHRLDCRDVSCRETHRRRNGLATPTRSLGETRGREFSPGERNHRRKSSAADRVVRIGP
jgi:hypothetical protein